MLTRWICPTRSDMQTVCQPLNTHCGHVVQILVKLSTSPIKISHRLRYSVALHLSQNRLIYFRELFKLMHNHLCPIMSKCTILPEVPHIFLLFVSIHCVWLHIYWPTRILRQLQHTFTHSPFPPSMTLIVCLQGTITLNLQFIVNLILPISSNTP